MRPVELSLIGFRSYPSQVTIDFTGKRLAAVLGDTGAGKSSLLDALTYALFRKCSWDAREVRHLIADGADAMSVTLTFLHGGQRWKVHRTMHATNLNAGRHHLVNVDTGQEEDGAGAVDARIKSVLQMSYETFLRVGLLPQGKFDQLLTAVPRERNERLRELFGTDALESVRQGAVRHRERLNELLAVAKTKREAMPENPAKVAEAAGAAADDAEAAAARLGSAIDTMSSLQKEAVSATAEAKAAGAVAESLAGHAVPDASASLGALEPLVTDFATRRSSLASRAEEADERDGVLTAKIGEIEAQGEGSDELVKAAAVVGKLAAQAEEYRGERDRLALVDAGISAEAGTIATTGSELTERVRLAKPLGDVADAAAEVSKRLRTLGVAVRTKVTEATTVARRVADTAHAHHVAVSKLEALHAAVTSSEKEASTAEAQVTAAEEHVNALRLRNQAAAVAAELHPGADCPVCLRELPDSFEPDAGASATDLTAATAQLRKMKAAGAKADRKFAEACAAVTAAESTESERAKDHHAAQQNVKRATETALQHFTDFASVAAEADEVFDAETASATLTAVTTALAGRPHGDSSGDAERLTVAIVEALIKSEHAAAARAEQLRTAETRENVAIEAERKALDERETAHRKTVEDSKAASGRHTRAVNRTTADIGALPARIRRLLPGSAIEVSTAGTAAAARAIAAQLAEVKDLLSRRESARREKNTVLKLQLALDQEQRTVVDEPLDKLRSRLDSWANAAARAAAQLPGADRSEMPEAPAEAESGISQIRAFAAALSTITADLRAELAEVKTAHAERAESARNRLGRLAADLSDVDGFDPAADLADPHSLHPLVAACARAGEMANSQRKAQVAAQLQVRPAADLDFAVKAGQARLAALEVLRGELVDAKFLGHLTELNTQALLGIASELLGQLTDLRFGFAANFEIVSRSSGVAHSPSRLSGGEKFLASLALALALAELHSLSGPRLGALFLDEGFAALDTTALQAALQVLRTRVGGDRLVMVISHLHAVAEAVDDVLWVERGVTGSRARWLTQNELDELVQADLASGLQILA